MGTMMYAPAVRVLINTQNEGTIDVSKDIVRGNIHLRENSIHTLDLGIANHRRKYDQVFTPNDRVSVQLKRLTWVQVFAGYLNTVPFFSAYPRTISLTASCTLKRLQYLLWDEGLQSNREMFNFTSLEQSKIEDIDGGMRDIIVKALRKVGQWDQGIHIGVVPNSWVHKAAQYSGLIESALEPPEDLVGTGSVFADATTVSGVPSTQTTPGSPQSSAPQGGQPSASSVGATTGGGTYPCVQESDGGPYAGGSNCAGGISPGAQAVGERLVQEFGGSFQGYACRPNTANTSLLSIHGTGRAVDYFPSSKTKGDQALEALKRNAAAWGVYYVIWYYRDYSCPTWATDSYGGPNPHTDHLHIEISSAAAGTSSLPPTNSGAGGVGSGQMFLYNWYQSGDPSSSLFAGKRRLINDQAFLPFIDRLCKASMRSYCSSPNGDFISWFPDYTGSFRMAGRMMVQNIELEDFTMNWDDQRLITHQFVTGTESGWGAPSAEAERELKMATGSGVATIEFPGIMDALMSEKAASKDPRLDAIRTQAGVMRRFGARVNHVDLGMISYPRAEFFHAMYLLQRNWSMQFIARTPVTFMPELFPGMLLVLVDYGVQLYVTGVNHSFNFHSGFTTIAETTVVSDSDGSGVLGVPR
jgi:hypothetical protein